MWDHTFVSLKTVALNLFVCLFVSLLFIYLFKLYKEAVAYESGASTVSMVSIHLPRLALFKSYLRVEQNLSFFLF